MARQFATIALLTLIPSALGFSSSVRMSARDAASSPLLSDRRDSLRRLALASAAASLTALAPPSARAVGQAAEDGLVKSPSGLAYYVTTEAKGGAVSTPTRGQRVVVDYTLWLIKPGAGRIFVDSTRGYKKEPLTFTAGVGEVIKGWDEAVLSMKVRCNCMTIRSLLGGATHAEAGAGVWNARARAHTHTHTHTRRRAERVWAHG